MQLQGRAVLVTGAGSGIGRATAGRMAAEGARVALLDLVDTTALADELPGQDHRAFVADVSSVDEVGSVFDQFRKAGVDLAGVVNSAGIVTGGPPWPDSDMVRMARVLGVNALGTALTTTLAAVYPPTGDRCVVNVSSVAAVRPHPPDPTYALTKAGVLAFSRSAAHCDRLRVNVVLPGVVRTAMLQTTGQGGPADWIRGRLDGPLLEADQVAGEIMRLFLDGHDGTVLTVELDPQDSTQLCVQEVSAA